MIKKINDAVYRIKRKSNRKPIVVHSDRLVSFLGSNHNQHHEQKEQVGNNSEQELEYEEFAENYGNSGNIRHDMNNQLGGVVKQYGAMIDFIKRGARPVFANISMMGP
ncbi:hypothetical protein Trydic_g7250 [Trypoxylus dichotomus]